jgi:hypothetical protein
MLTKDEVANLVGEFTWDFGCYFFIETSEGNFIWSDPDYQGDNTIKATNLSYEQWITEKNIFGRSKGKHIIGHYCGKDFSLA